MKVGLSHNWVYPKGSWHEQKVAPDRWTFSFSSTKIRTVPAPDRSGAMPDTRYHWYILADQRVRKVDKDSYETLMEGIKFKLGHKRPYWKGWSYEYPDQMGYRERLIGILEETVSTLRDDQNPSSDHSP